MSNQFVEVWGDGTALVVAILARINEDGHFNDADVNFRGCTKINELSRRK